MGFFSFGKKKKHEVVAPAPAPAPPATTTARGAAATARKSTNERPNKLVNNTSASSSLSAATAASSSGSSAYQHQATPPTSSSMLSPNPRRLNTHPSIITTPKTTAIATAGIGNDNDALAPPRPLLGVDGAQRLSHSNHSSSSSLNAPVQPFAQPIHISKKGSTNTLNSISSNNGNNTTRRRGTHEAPKLANLSSASKPRASSYHASTTPVRNIWTNGMYNNGSGSGSRSELGHSMFLNQNQNGSGYFGFPKYASTGSPGGFMSRTTSYSNLRGSSSTPSNQASQLPRGGIAPDEEFKAYTRTYDATITRAHQLAREYHHLPPLKRDREGYERVGKAFAEAARVSRLQWTLRCQLEKERLEDLLLLVSKRESGKEEEKERKKRQMEVEVNGEYTSLHRIAGMRACEGWEYASMLAEAWGVSEEEAVKGPLEEMPVLKPEWPQYPPQSQPQYQGGGYADEFGYGSPAEFVHPGYNQAAYAEYIAQQQRYQQHQQQQGGGGGGAYTRPRNMSVRTRLDSGVSVAETTSTHSGGHHHQAPVPRQRNVSSSTNPNTAGTANATMGAFHGRTTSGGAYAPQGQGATIGVGTGRNRTTSGMSLNHSASLPALASAARAERSHPNPNPNLNLNPHSTSHGGMASGRSSNEVTPDASMTSPTSSSVASSVPAPVTPMTMAFPTNQPSSSPTTSVSKSLPLTPKAVVASVSLSNSMEPVEPEVKVIKLSKGRRYRREGASAAAAM